MNKIISILLSILLIFNGFNYPIFADETETDENNEPDTTEISNDNKLIETENKKEIENINNEIKSIKNDITLINNSISEYNVPPFYEGGEGRLTNFDLLTPEQLIIYYTYFSNFGVIFVDYQYYEDTENYMLLGAYLSDTNIQAFDEMYSIESTDMIYILPDGSLFTETGNGFLGTFYPLNYTDDIPGSYLIARNNNFNLYVLNPYKLNVVNNGIGTYSNSVVSEPYLSTNIYYSGQSITLTYDNTNNDFYGWFDNSGNLLSNDLSYSFNINSDTTIILNYPLLNDSNNSFDSTYLIYIILLLTLLFFTQIEKGVLNGN